MTTYTSFKRGGTTGIINSHASEPRGVQKAQFDIAKFVTTNSFVSGDIEQLLTIPARTLMIIHAVYPDTTLALGGTPVFSLGDVANAGTYWVNASSNVTAGTHFTVAQASYLYDAADKLIVTLSNSSGTVTSGKFTVVYEMIDCTASVDAAATPTV